MTNLQRMNDKTLCRTTAAAASLIVLGLALAGCEESDPTAPAESTITVSANPQTVSIPEGEESATTEITATVRSKNGTRLPDQEVTFSTTAGDLDPLAETPIITDDQGRATSILTTKTNATVTARSGGISATTQVQITPALAQFILNVSPSFLSSCNDEVTLEALVLTTTGNPEQGTLVIFDETPDSEVTGTFDPGSQVQTNASGIATVTWTPTASVCAAQCQSPPTGDPNAMTPGVCDLFFIADDLTHTFTSVKQKVDDNIP